MASSTSSPTDFRIVTIALFTLLNLLSPILAQTLISPTLPACGQQCPVLLQAQGGCVPPAAPVTNQGIYQSCFCQSAFLQPLYSGQTQSCPTCSTQDMATVQNWFQGLCKQGAPVQQPGSTVTITSSSSTSSTPAATSSAGLTGVNETATPSGPTPSWMSTHWRWVVMLIVLFLGLALVALAFWLLHRRYRRKKAARATAPSEHQPDLGAWAPGQSVHDFGAGVGSVNNEKGKGREQVAVAPAAGAPPAVPPTAAAPTKNKRGSRVLRK